MSKTLSNQMVEWNEINWRKLEKNVYKLQKRIFQASIRGDTKVIRRLQKTLMRSWSGKALSVRKVTQDNQGKKTAGVDGIKSLTPKARQNLVLSLDINKKVNATRRASPFDGNLKYWSSRRGEHPLVTTKVTRLLKVQKGKCAHCGLYFREDDLIEVDHIIPKSQGGKDNYSNFQALHRHCHDSKTANDNLNSNRRNAVMEEDEFAAW